MRFKNRIWNLLMAFVLVVTAFMSMQSPGQTVQAATTDLLISEYIEGSSVNKAIEIYNGTGTSVDLAAGIYTWNFTATEPQPQPGSLALTGTIADGDVFVLANTGADAAILAVADVTSNAVINFNGDDALVLRKDGSLVDSFGQVGVDPGSEWTGWGCRRKYAAAKSHICAGDTDPDDAFDVSVEWDGFAHQYI